MPRVRRTWSMGEDALLRQQYHSTLLTKLARMLGRSVSSVHTHAQLLGLERLPAREIHRLHSPPRRARL